MSNPFGATPGNLGFLAKILLVSAGISVAIKSLGPQLAIPPQPAIALTIVLLPALSLALALLGRGWQQRP